MALSGLAALSQDVGTGALTLGVGGAFPADGFRISPFHDGPAFYGDYEVRLYKYVVVIVGVDNYWLTYNNSGRLGITETRERVTILPFSLRGILPLKEGSVELFAGTGAAYVWGTADNFRCCAAESFLVQANGGGRIAIDPAKRFYLGTTAKYFRDLGRPTQQWVSWDCRFRDTIRTLMQ